MCCLKTAMDEAFKAFLATLPAFVQQHAALSKQAWMQSEGIHTLATLLRSKSFEFEPRVAIEDLGASCRADATRIVDDFVKKIENDLPSAISYFHEAVDDAFQKSVAHLPDAVSESAKHE